ncbi:MAG: AAA family ATPase [Patescibacteria group bacterium]|nr:AAA family ATPase [Patescibacteria group bacterium]MDE1967001.1 AAA family ATPase [Patescibacteria group bacterium]
MTNPFLILVDGPMGSGKTTTTKLLNQMLPDTARVALPDIKRLVPNYKENEKTLMVIREVMKAMIDKYLEFGVSVIVEQITKVDGVQALREIATKRDANFYAYRLTAPKDDRLKRVHERTRVMMAVAELPQSKIDELSGYFEPNHQFYLDNPINTIESIDTQNLSPEKVAEIIIGKIL